MKVFLRVLLAVVMTLIVFAGWRSAGEAQTAPTLRCSVDNTSPVVNTTINIACTLSNATGQAVPNTALTFYVNFQARTDASFPDGRTTSLITTDAAGKANGALRVGDKPGEFGILVNYPGIYSFSQVVNVRPGQSPPPASLPAATTPLASVPVSSTPSFTPSTSTAGSVAAAPSGSSVPASTTTMTGEPFIIRPPSTGNAGLR